MLKTPFFLQKIPYCDTLIFMIVTLKNNQYQVSINSLGAQIVSFKDIKNNKSIVWDGDSDIWAWSAPLCFPFCSKATDNFFIIDGKRYEFTNGHGFIREYHHELVHATEKSLEWEITPNAEMKARFPYEYSFKTRYELVPNGLLFTVTVTNTSNRTIYYSFGTHTSFWTAKTETEQLSDYVIEFEKNEDFQNLYSEQNCFKTRPLNAELLPELAKMTQKNQLPLYTTGFETGLILTGLKSAWAGLRNKKTGSLVKVLCKDFENLIIWQNTVGRKQFVCIEPWNGMADTIETNHIFEQKHSIQKLEAGHCAFYDQSILIE